MRNILLLHQTGGKYAVQENYNHNVLLPWAKDQQFQWSLFLTAIKLHLIEISIQNANLYNNTINNGCQSVK